MSKHFRNYFDKTAWLHNGDGIERKDQHRFQGTAVRGDNIGLFVYLSRTKWRTDILAGERHFEKPSVVRNKRRHEGIKKWRQKLKKLKRQGVHRND